MKRIPCLTAMTLLLACGDTEGMRAVNPGASTDAGNQLQDSGMSQIDGGTSQMDAAMPVADAGQGSQSPDIGTMISPGECEDEPVANPIQARTGTVNGSSFLYTKKTDAKGLLLLFHGGGGSMDSNFSVRIEAVLIAQAAEARGFALASLNSAKHLTQNPQDTKWEETAWVSGNPASNQDVSNALDMIALLRGSLNAVPANTPVFLMGFSNGGTMASNVAQAFDATAAVTYISNSKAFKKANAKVPPFMMVIGENDSNNMKISAETIQDLHPEVQVFVNPPKPVMPGIFTRIPGISCEVSKSIGEELDSLAWLDSDDKLTMDPKDRNATPDWASALPMEYRNGMAKDPFTDILVERYAGHSPSADWNNIVFDFLEAQLP